MAVGELQFVDSIAATPTVRLDLNDETVWTCTSITANPPRLRRGVSSNAMRDGVHVGTSTYDSREVLLELDVRKTTKDLSATELQKLARELDRETNYLKWQLNGFTKPVFFVLYRSDFESAVRVQGQEAYYKLTVRLMAEPFALGLQESGTGSISQTPSTTGLKYDFPAILGDVATPARLAVTSDQNDAGFASLNSYFVMLALPPGRTYVTRHVELNASVTGSADVGVETADALFSGGGYRRTSFSSSPSMMTFTIPAATAPLIGTHRLLVRARTTRTTAPFRVDLSATVSGRKTSQPISITHDVASVGTATRWHDLGIVTTVAASYSKGTTPDIPVVLSAALMSGAGTWDWDAIAFLPADLENASVSTLFAWVPQSDETHNYVYDSADETVYRLDTSGVLTSTSPGGQSGGFPYLQPDAANHLSIVTSAGGTLTFGPTFVGATLATDVAVAWSYFPRYLYVRPSAT